MAGRETFVPEKIFLYGMNYAPEMIGVGRYSGELGAYLARHGAQVEVVTTAPHYPGWSVRPSHGGFEYRTEIVDSARVTRCPMIMRKEMRGVWRALAPLSFALFSAPVALWRMLRMRPATVLVVEPTLFVAPVALLGAWLVGARKVLHVQDLEIDAGFAVGHLKGAALRRFAAFCERVLVSAFDRVITVSGEMEVRLAGKGVPQDRLAIIRNWVDTAKIVPLDGANSYRRELDLPDTAYVVLYAGNIGAKQALPVVLDAAGRLADESGIVFVIAGDGPEKRNLQVRYGKLPNVRFLPLQPEARLCELLNLPDLHLLPQDRNAADLVLPSKLGGMLASGRDILASADPGTELYKFLAGTAIIVPSGDSERMAAAIRAQACEGRRRPTAAHAQVTMLDAGANLARFSEMLGVAAARAQS